jgi:histidine triad (HIT) family protein
VGKEVCVDYEDCVFCQIIGKKMTSDIIHEDDELIAFHDINPQSPTHILILPKKHIPSLSQITDEDSHLLGKMLKLARQIAIEENLVQKGFRITLNEGKDGGQTIYHIHMHLLAGRHLMWPPG